MTLNHWVVGSIPTRCMPQRQRLRCQCRGKHKSVLGHFLDSFSSISGASLGQRCAPWNRQKSSRLGTECVMSGPMTSEEFHELVEEHSWESEVDRRDSPLTLARLDELERQKGVGRGGPNLFDIGEFVPGGDGQTRPIPRGSSRSFDTLLTWAFCMLAGVGLYNLQGSLSKKR